MRDQHRLIDLLEQIADRVAWARRLNGLGWAWCGLAVLTWSIVIGLRPSGAAWDMMAFLIPALAAVCVVGVSWQVARDRTTPRDIARRLEALDPSLDARLITAVEQVPDISTGRLTLLQRLVVREASALVRADWGSQLVPRWQITLPVVLLMLDAVMLGSAWATGAKFARHQGNLTAATTTSSSSTDDLPVKIEPGDIELERGTALLILARFQEPVPARVQVVMASAAESPSTVELVKSLDDPVFGTRIPEVREDLTYHVEFDGRKTRDYRVTVFDLPALVRGDITIRPPGYTQRPEVRRENAFETTVVEGSQVVLDFKLNKAVKSAKLVNKEGQDWPLTADASDPLHWSLSLTPTQSLRAKLQLVDDRDRHNRDPESFRIDVVPNQPPTIELAFPGKDVRVSPLEELLLEGRVRDDFGIEELGVVLTVAGREPTTIPLGRDLPGDKPQTLQLLQAMEELNVQPDDLVSYHLYAVDRGPDGELRKVTGDLYFAEVRPFEESFRQMDAPPGAQGASGSQQQQGSPFEGLIQVQKQIVAATWNLVRREAVGWRPETEEQVGVISESQTTNQTKLLELSTHLNGAAQQRLATLASERMSAAKAELDKASETDQRAPLNVALASEQAAYQALLKLRARDHNVMQGQPSGGGSGGGASASEQQLEQLELSDKQNRYEQRSQSGEEAGSAQQEELGLLNRLKELARRQGDLNEKLKELDAALRLAASAEQKAEIERQLKRLRDEQQQLLQDADDLRNRMAQSQQQEKFQDAREQLDQTRNRLVESTEALREGQTSQALSSSSRAERELNQLQQDFRQQTSARFADAMRNLREATRELAQRERELSQRLAGSNPEEKPSLRLNRDRQTLQGDFERQRANLEDVLKQSREIVQDAEVAEPLLSQELYDTIRSARDDKVEAALDAVPQLIQRGFVPEAQKAEEVAQRGLDRLQSGIEKAAESVLGNEVESLKRARREIAELSSQLQAELNRSEGSKPGNGQAGQEVAPGKSGESPSDPGMPREGQPQQGQGQQGQGQQGQGQQGQGQQGQGQQGQGQQGQGQQGQGQQGQGQGQGGGASGGNAAAQQPGQSGTPARGQAGLRRGQPGSQGSSGSSGSPLAGNAQGGMGGGAGTDQGGPISGEGYREWSERLRDVETMVADPDLQAQVAKLREQARSLRAEFKRHSENPNWSLVETSLYEPLIELEQRLAEEVSKRESDDSLVPIDRDPVPARYRELVRSYYERLSREEK